MEKVSCDTNLGMHFDDVKLLLVYLLGTTIVTLSSRGCNLGIFVLTDFVDLGYTRDLNIDRSLSCLASTFVGHIVSRKIPSQDMVA